MPTPRPATVILAILLAGCATGEAPPPTDAGQLDVTVHDQGPAADRAADAPADAPVDAPAELAVDGQPDGVIDAFPDAAVDAAADAAPDASDAAAGDSGLCGQTGCDDGLACTDDLCLEGGTCAFLLKAGHCLIEGVCYQDGDKQSATGCNACASASSSSGWTPDAALCADDGLACTTATCSLGSCTHLLDPGNCLVGGACVAHGAASASNSCQYCDTTISTAALQTKGDGAACAADALACTDDLCVAGACTHPQQAGTCLIGGACYASGAKHPTADCLGCVPSTSGATWTTLADGTPCSADSYWCTTDSCTSGICTHVTQSTACLIGGQCYSSGAKNVINDCLACNPAASGSSWTALTDGAPCAADAFTCTSDSCQSGLCTHPVQSGSCLIGGACYASGTVNPSGACGFCKPTASQSVWSPISYQGCCALDVVVFCENSTLTSIDCSANPSCGWSAVEGYYDCGTAGGADPAGTNPKDC